MSDKKLNKLREHQNRLRWLIRSVAATHRWPFPSFEGWPDEDRRALEVAIRVNCATEAKSDAELFERLESKHRSALINKATASLRETAASDEDREAARSTLKNLAPQQQSAISLDESEDLTFLVYLLDVADILAGREAAPAA